MRYLLMLGFLQISSILYSQTHFYVANRNGNNVFRFSMDGELIEEFVTAGSGGLSSPQDVLFHPLDGSFLVTGFQNPKIKRYDGLSGAFLGDFSSGFELDNPTKMNIGPDSLLYVAQLGNPDSKIIRFDLDGNFVDEWSEVDVPEGCGMDWDSQGNLYITTWSNGQNNGTAGFVRKFDNEGNDLGIIVNNSILQGPTGIWIDDQDDLFVVDWTLGRVSQFNSSGAFVGHFITGMVRTEGDAIGPEGKYYLCDWQANGVNRYHTDGTFDTLLVNTGLSVPNAITFGPDGLVDTQETLQEEHAELVIFPNPVDEVLYFNYSTSHSKKVLANIFDSQGKQIYVEELEINAGYHIYTIPLNFLENGAYHLYLIQKQSVKTGTFIKN